MDKKIRDQLLAIPQVVGVGQGFKEVGGVATQDQAVIVLVKKKLPSDQLSAEQLIPNDIDGVVSDVIEVGDLQAQGSTMVDLEPDYEFHLGDQRTSKIRPAVPGISIAHYKVTAGTFGAVVYDKNTGEPLILSNNHILANSSNGKDGRARIGDPIFQPGPIDGGTSSANILAKLTRYFTLDDYPHPNEVDCALARPLKKDMIDPNILGIGKVSGITKPALGMSVRKSGRTTGLTMGRIRVVDVTTDVNYGQGRTLRFTNQIVTTPMSEGGDSGSLVVDKNNQAVGLLFAGSDKATILNPIETVLKVLKVQFK